jgi:hypothetical protein
LMHGDILAAGGPHRCAAFPFPIEIETAPKSLFFPKFQHVSVRPISNVGTAVMPGRGNLIPLSASDLLLIVAVVAQVTVATTRMAPTTPSAA